MRMRRITPKNVGGAQTYLCTPPPVLSRVSVSEVFCQDPVERYFSRQRNRGGGNDNPTVEQFQKNAAILLQKQQLHWDLKSANVQPGELNVGTSTAMQPLAKRPRKQYS